MCSEPVMRAPRQRLGVLELAADRHQAGHLVLGEADLLAAELGEREVGDLEVLGGERAGGVMRSPVGVGLRRRRAAPGASPAPSAASRRARRSPGAPARSRTTRRPPARSVGLGAQAPREAQLGEPELEARQQLAQRPQALQLLGAVEPVAAGRAAQREQSGALDVAKHPRRPAGRLRGLVDRQRLHRRARTLPQLCQGCCAGRRMRRPADRCMHRSGPGACTRPTYSGSTTSIQSSERPQSVRASRRRDRQHRARALRRVERRRQRDRVERACSCSLSALPGREVRAAGR